MTNLAVPDNLSMADSILPSFDWEDAKKRKYLSYRLCGFSRMEAVKHASITLKKLQEWRRADTAFDEVEKLQAPDLRRQYAKEVMLLEYTRNLRLTLEKDTEILEKSLDDGRVMSKNDTEYLLKMRAYYTPAQLKALEELLTIKDDNGWKDFDEIIIARRRRGDQETQPYDEIPSFPT